MATRILNNSDNTIGTAEVEYDFDPAEIPATGKAFALVEAAVGNTGTIQFGNKAIVAAHAAIVAGGKHIVPIKNGRSNLRAKASLAAQAFNVSIIQG